MTTLGLVFCAIFFAALVLGGRRALVLAIAASVPFNDSIAASVGGLGGAPYFAGVALYVAATLWVRFRDRKNLVFGYGDGSPNLLAGFYFYAVAVTLIAPTVFAGIGVMASGIGLDEQVGALTPLTYTPSNVAQIGYLTLSTLFVLFNEADQYVTRQYFVIVFTVGILVALATDMLGMHDFFRSLFDNSARGQYATNTIRLRGQFAEPSHLGAFSMCAVVYFGTAVTQVKTLRGLAAALTMLGLSGYALARSASGTGIVGLVITACIIGALAVVVVLAIPTSPRTIAFTGAYLLAGLILVPFAIPWARQIMSQKQDSTSSITRQFADDNGWHLMTDTIIGTGLGSNRTSSMFYLLISTVGLLGTALFVAMVVRSIARGLHRAETLPTAFALLAFVTTAFVSIADFASPLLWSLIAGCYAANRLGAEPAGEHRDQPESVATRP